MFAESVAIALNALVANKMRSILTMLGIIIGVGAVIAMISIGMGVQQQVQNSIAGLGSNLIMVTPGAASSSGSRQAAGSSITLTYKDAQAIAREVVGVRQVAPSVSSSYQVVAGNQNWTTRVHGTTPEYQEVRNTPVQTGSFISSQDVETRSRVAVIGTTVAANLFGEGVNAIGQSIRINNAPFKVVGILESKGEGGGGMDQDDLILVPLTTAQERLMGITFIHMISIQAENTDTINEVQQELSNVLRSRHKITGDKEDDFQVRNMVSVMNTAAETTQTITLLLGNIAAISLLVGGIGIMNIMLVSVTERTREIGIRKALGAKFKDVLMQFLIEAVVIGVVGGSIGIALGIGASYIVSYFAGWPTIISPVSIVAAFVFSVGVGLFFGIYPARKAALLDPIDALRYE